MVAISKLVEQQDVQVSSASPASDSAVPRFNLKKRTVSGERCGSEIPTVNSAFLSGLFADVANVHEETTPLHTPHDIPSDLPPCETAASWDEAKPSKKSRLSLTKSLTRCGMSFKVIQDGLKSPSDVTSVYFMPADADSVSFDRQDSLYFQLVSLSKSSSANVVGPCEAVKLAFPQLPCSITSTYCSERPLLRKVSDVEMNKPTADWSKESYGWFVEMDSDDDQEAYHSTSPTASTTRDLAFTAPTAPKATVNDAEIEWAQAADTVDEVLGDFF